MILFPTLLWLGAANLASTMVMDKPANSCGQTYGLFGTYVVPDSNISIRLYAAGHTGASSVVTLDLSRFEQDYNYKSRATNGSLPLPQSGGGGVCNRITSCAGNAAESATAAAIFLANVSQQKCQAAFYAVRNFWSADDYANVRKALWDFPMGITVNLAYTPLGNAIINSMTGSTDDKDSCDVADREDSATYFAGALYDFCMAIQRAKSVDDIEKIAVNGEFNDDVTKVSGKVTVTKNFIASQADVFGPACQNLGIVWKRGLLSTLRTMGF